ncbi:hypothetical protein C5L31_001635 [Secundilactobacillus malefermentans]|uniref:Uncharacterized protein n=1 Tax=Secundilactobacillus malefermentans TaxID=176292 RepID=A0A4R5NCK6_9LACO|nr:glycosyltransferase family 4 protein [Secundilactobacillus malefermentans]TDG70858.1 hypothetical protein C5L31_001635 [Secundilactobacillus malefermentans]
MLKINMFSTADKVKGQGVGSAYLELVKLLSNRAKNKLSVEINKYRKADISHYHTINFPFFLSTFFSFLGRKIGYVHFLPETLEGSLKIPQPFRSIFYHYVIAFYKRMDHLVVVNPTFIPKLEAYGIKKEDITYIPNFVSRTEFYESSAEEKKKLRLKYGYTKKFIVLGVGQIQERKGLFDFIELAKRLPNIQFIWAGGFSFGRITDGYSELKKVVDNPPENLSFPGIVDRNKLVDYYNLSDVFLLPSYSELFPMSILESFSTGTPVLLRDLDLYPAIIEDDYVPAKDVNEMFDKLVELESSPEMITHFQEVARSAAAYYSEDRLVKIWEDFYWEQAKEGK